MQIVQDVDMRFTITFHAKGLTVNVLADLAIGLRFLQSFSTFIKITAPTLYAVR
jgi:hypothetical protein